LQEFSSDKQLTRRATESIQASTDLLEFHMQNKPRSIDELYTKTLPEMRSKLKRQSLRQSGHLQPVTQDQFEKYKYQMSIDRHDPFHPKGIVDPTLEYFRPKQMIGTVTNDAQDDLLINAIKNMHVDLKIPNITIGSVIEYVLKITTTSDQPLDLSFGFVLSHPATSRVVSYSERKVTVKGKMIHSLNGNFGAETSSMVIGTYRVNCRIYVVTNGKNEYLSSFGPIEFIIQSK
jgi:hypothetical protein